jgi:hypothetical protein
VVEAVAEPNADWPNAGFGAAVEDGVVETNADWPKAGFDAGVVEGVVEPNADCPKAGFGAGDDDGVPLAKADDPDPVDRPKALGVELDPNADAPKAGLLGVEPAANADGVAGCLGCSTTAGVLAPVPRSMSSLSPIKAIDAMSRGLTIPG